MAHLSQREAALIKKEIHISAVFPFIRRKIIVE